MKIKHGKAQLNSRSENAQEFQVLSFLKQGHTLTALMALELFGCQRLAARICRLRKKGFQIEARQIKTISGKKIAAYYLEA